MENNKNLTLLFLGILISISAIVYLNTISKSFFWDDELLVKNNVHIRSLKNIPVFFNPGYANVYESAGGGRYRPLRTTSFVFDHLLWGEDARGYHVTNIILHNSATLILFFLVKIMTGNNLAAFLSGLVFAVHPIHTESIIFIKNRSDVLCAIFYFLSMLLFVKFVKDKPPRLKGIGIYISGLAVFCLSLLSKEMAVTLPFMLLCYVFFFRGGLPEQPLRGIMKKVYLTIPYFLILAAYFAFRKFVMKGGYALEIASLKEKFFIIAETAGGYIKLVFLPFNLSADRSLLVSGRLVDLEVIMFLIIILAVVPLIMIKRNELSFWAFFFIFCIIPVSNLVFLAGRPFAEQRMYLPSAGMAVFTGILLGKAIKYKKIAGIVLTLFVVMTYSYAAINRNSDWKDEKTFWKKTSESNPHSARALQNLSIVYGKEGRYGEAIECLNKSLKINDKFIDSYNTLGWLYYKMNLYERSAEVFEKGLKLEPRHYDMATNLGAVYSILGKYEKAYGLYRKTLDTVPWSYRTYYNLGVTCVVMKRYGEAIDCFYRSIELNPFDDDPY